LREVYDEITVHYGEEHDYLGMTLMYKPEQKTILLTMKDYVNDVLDQIKQDNEDEMIKTVKTLASENLFKTRKKSDDTQLNKYKSGQFHSTVAKLLFLAKRGRPDILLAVSFLTTRVKSPDLDDWKKLLRILGYLQGNMELEWTLTCNDLKTFTWYIDGLYAVNEDMKGHSGAIMTIGDNVALSRSNKQKVNT
jgi:hypothetical protein